MPNDKYVLGKVFQDILQYVKALEYDNIQLKEHSVVL